MSRPALRITRLPLGVLVSAFAIAGLLMFPKPALGVQSVTTTISASAYPLGFPIPGTVTIDLEPDEFITNVAGAHKATVTLDVIGPQNVSFNLPLAAGLFTLSKNGATLAGVVSHVGVQTGDFSEDGYDVGYKAGSGGGSITISFTFTQRILLDPAPLSLAALPDVSAIFDPLTIPGAASAPSQTPTSAGIPGFPAFGAVGNATIAGNRPVRGIDARPGTGDSLAVLGILFDGDEGENDIYAEFDVVSGVDGPSLSLRSWFNLPDTSSGLQNMGRLHGIAFIDEDTIAVVGGDDPNANDAFLAVFDLDGGPPATSAFPVVSSFIGSLGSGALENSLGHRPGGIAFDGTDILVADYQDAPGADVTVAKISTDLTGVSTFTVPLGFASAAGLDALTGDTNSGTPVNRFFGLTDSPDFGAGPEGARIVEFDGNGVPQGLRTATGLPAGETLSGAGLVDDINDTDGSSLMFVVTQHTRQVLVSHVPAPAPTLADGEFSNEPQAVDYDVEMGKFLVPVRGNPNSHLAVFDANLSFDSQFELVGLGNLAEAAYVSGAGTYWVVDSGSPPTITQIDPYNSGTTIGAPIVLPAGAGEIGGLAGAVEGDTTYLYAYEAARDVFYKIDTSSGTRVAVNVFDDNAADHFHPPSGVSGLSYGQVDGAPRLIAARFDQAYVIDPATGGIETGFELPVASVSGLGSGSLLIADAQDGVGKIMGSMLPGESTREATAVGQYTMVAHVDNSGAGGSGEFGPVLDSATVSFDLTKLASVGITLNAPLDGGTVSSTTVTVEGQVDDPTVTRLTVFAEEPGGTILGNGPDGAGGQTPPDGPSGFESANDRAQYTATGSNDLWHATSSLPQMLDPSGAVIEADGNTAFYYGQGESAGNFNYDTGGANFGYLDSATFTVDGANSELGFDVWYGTEPTALGPTSDTSDRKTIEFCASSSSCQDLFRIVSFAPDPTASGFVEPSPGTVPDGVTVGAQFDAFGKSSIFVPSQRGGGLGGGTGQFTRISYALDSLVGQTGFIRIAFESVDGSNGTQVEQGVVVDNLEVTGPRTIAESFPVSGRAFGFDVKMAEGTNHITLIASSQVPGTVSGSVAFSTIVDTMPPTLTIDPVASPTTSDSQVITGEFSEVNPKQLTIEVNGAATVVQTAFIANATTYSHNVGLVPNASNSIVVTLTDLAGGVTSVGATIIVDTTPPTVDATFVPILSDSGVRPGDNFFVIASANDSLSGIASVTMSSGQTLTYTNLASVDAVPSVVIKKHSMTSFGPSTTTHVGMTGFDSGTPTGLQEIVVDAVDGAGNVGTASINVNVVDNLDNRSVFLMPGQNYVGFPLIPTTASLDELLAQDVTNANPALVTAMQAFAGREVRLSDVVDVVYAYDSAIPAFTQFRPDGSVTNSLTTLSAFDGLIVVMKSQVTVDGAAYDVFDMGTSLGSSVPVPIRWNVGGVLARPAPALPPQRSMLTGWNLWTPHASDDGLFESPGFLRGAMIASPGDLAASAITQVDRVDAVADSNAPGGFDVEIESGPLSDGPGDLLRLTRSYWTYMTGDATLTP